jgi:putative ATPase
VAQQYLPTRLLGRRFYEPGDLGYEQQVRDRLARWRADSSDAERADER